MAIIVFSLSISSFLLSTTGAGAGAATAFFSSAGAFSFSGAVVVSGGASSCAVAAAAASGSGGGELSFVLAAPFLLLGGDGLTDFFLLFKVDFVLVGVLAVVTEAYFSITGCLISSLTSSSGSTASVVSSFASSVFAISIGLMITFSTFFSSSYLFFTDSSSKMLTSFCTMTSFSGTASSRWSYSSSSST